MDNCPTDTTRPGKPTTGSCILYRVPIEIRSLIYQSCFDANPEPYDRGAQQQIFQALFPDKNLYSEAVNQFYKSQGAFLDKTNICGFQSNFSDDRLLLINQLRLEIDIQTNSRSTAPEDILPDAKQKKLHEFLDFFITGERATNPRASQRRNNSGMVPRSVRRRNNRARQASQSNKLSLLTNLNALTIQFQVRDTAEYHGNKGALRRFDRILILIEKCFSVFPQLKELRVILLMAGASGFAANFFDKMHVLLGVQGELVRGMRRDGSGTVMWKDKYSRTDEWVWRAGGREGLRKVGKVRKDDLVGEW